MSILDRFWQAGLVTKPDDITKYIWWSDGNTVSWNTDNNLEDLYLEQGNTYQQVIEHEGRGVIIQNCIIMLIDDSCGGRGQVIFNLDMKVKEPDY